MGGGGGGEAGWEERERMEKESTQILSVSIATSREVIRVLNLFPHP